MVGLEWLVAAFILQGPEVNTLPDQDAVVKLYTVAHVPLRQLALACELLDQREVRYVLVRQDEFLVDVRMLQRRQRDLYDAPAVSDAQRFPDRGTVNELLIFNRAYRQHIDSCLPLYPNCTDLRAAKEEVEQLYQVWDSVRDARCEYYYVHIRRQALKKLRDMLGDEDYSAGVLPPHVPIWRFESIK